MATLLLSAKWKWAQSQLQSQTCTSRLGWLVPASWLPSTEHLSRMFQKPLIHKGNHSAMHVTNFWTSFSVKLNFLNFMTRAWDELTYWKLVVTPCGKHGLIPGSWFHSPQRLVKGLTSRFPWEVKISAEIPARPNLGNRFDSLLELSANFPTWALPSIPCQFTKVPKTVKCVDHVDHAGVDRQTHCLCFHSQCLSSHNLCMNPTAPPNP